MAQTIFTLNRCINCFNHLLFYRYLLYSLDISWYSHTVGWFLWRGVKSKTTSFQEIKKPKKNFSLHQGIHICLFYLWKLWIFIVINVFLFFFLNIFMNTKNPHATADILLSEQSILFLPWKFSSLEKFEPFKI